jgi:hypothetical protein
LQKDLKALYDDLEHLNNWIECRIGDVEFKIPPSALAPSAAAAVRIQNVYNCIVNVCRDSDRDRDRASHISFDYL